jgi:hypothetical protein
MWIAFLDTHVFEEEAIWDRGWEIEGYRVRLFEKWIRGFHYNHVWFYDAKAQSLYLGSFPKVETDLGDGRRFYSRPSLRLYGGYQLTELDLRVSQRAAFEGGSYYWPACQIATFRRKDTRLKWTAFQKGGAGDDSRERGQRQE